MVRPMKVLIRELMDKLGVEHVLNAYDSAPWSAYDATKGLTCSAEVRMNTDGTEIDAEIQLVYDTPPAGTAPVEQIMAMHFRKILNDKWSPDTLRVRKDQMHSKLFDWESKGCEFFTTCCVFLTRGEIPDIDELIERIFKPADNYRAGAAGGSGRKPSIKPEQLLDPSKRF
jgi:hypothetical protein